MAQTYNRVAVWGSGLRPRAVASAERALPPSAYNTTRLQGTNRKQWPAPHPMRGGDFRSSTFAGAPVARGSSARALPPDVYNRNRLSGANKRHAPVGQPRTAKTRAALMRGDAAEAGQLTEPQADAPQPTFDINEIVAGLRAALESAESDEERDTLNEQLATLRPFVLLSKKRALTDEEQGIVDEIGRALLAQAEGQAAGEVQEDAAQRITYDADQAQASDAREVLAELERDLATKADIAARRVLEVDQFAAAVRAHVPEIQKEALKLEGESKKARADRRAIEKRLAEIPDEVAAAELLSDEVAVRALAAEEKAAEEDKQRALDYIAGAADRLREIAAEEAAIATEGPRLKAERDAAIDAVKDAGDALGLAPQPEGKVPRKRARNVPTREDAARQQQIEILEEALNPLSTNIKRALFEMGQQGQAQQAQAGPPPQYISSWTEKSIMAPVNEGASIPILKGVLKKALGSIGTNRQGNAPNKKELFALIREHSLAQELADAVIAAGR